jgi:hypothetical protein
MEGLITKREFVAGAVAMAVVFTAGLWGNFDFLMAAEPEQPEECRDYAVRLQEDNGWSNRILNPPRFYCDTGHRLELFRDGLIACACPSGSQ